MPSSTKDEVQTKYEALKVFADAAPTTSESAQAAAAQLRLLLELKGSLLNEDAFESAPSFYEIPVPQNAACMGEYTDLEMDEVGCSIDPSTRKLRGLLTFCGRLTSAYVPWREVDANSARCLGAGKELASGTDTCMKPRLRSAHAAMSEAFAQRLFEEPLPSSSAAARVAELRRRLEQISAWYESTRPLYDESERAELDALVGKITGAFSRGVHRRELNAVAPNDPQAIARLAIASETTDREVLEAAFAAPLEVPPLEGIPLLYIVGDALQATIERMDALSSVHDALCRYSNCTTAMGTSDLTASWKALSLLQTPDELRTTLELQSTYTRLPSSWNTVLSPLGSVDNPLTKALSSSDAVESPAVGRLLRVIEMAAQRVSTFDANKVLGTERWNSIHIGLQDAVIQAAVANVDEKRASLSAAVTQYENGRTGSISDILKLINNDQEATQINTNVTLGANRFLDLERRVAALQVNFATSEQTFGDVAKAFGEMVERDRESADLRFARHPETLPQSLTAAHARYVPHGPRSIADLAVLIGDAPWKRSARAGDVLNIDVDGTWSPTCALSRSDLSEKMVGLDAVSVGPEGFLLQSQQSNYHVSSNGVSRTTVESTEDSWSARACAGVRAAVGSPSLTNSLGFSAEAYALVETCMARSGSSIESESDEHRNSTGAEARASSLFSSGLRLDNTPFPGLPAGSLLLVGVIPGRFDLEGIRMIRVLQSPHTGFPVGEELDFYLIVNDRGDCAHASNGNGLTVGVTTLEPAGRAAKALGQAMSTALVRLRAKRDSLVAQGELLPDDTVSLRSQAEQDLREAYGTDPRQHMPQGYFGFYSSWVDAEIVKIEQLVAIRKLRFEQEQLRTELASYAHDIEVNGTKARLLRLVPQWALRSLEADKVGRQLNELADALLYQLSPAADLRFPQARQRILADANLQARIAHAMADMTTKPFVVLAAEFRDVADSIANHFDASVLASTAPGQNTFRAVVSFPRPDLPPDVEISNFNKASEPRARAVWEAAERGGVARFEIRPEDIYANEGFSILPCNQASPVINWMTLFVAGIPMGVATSFNQQYWFTQIRADNISWFPTESGVLSYNVNNDRIREGGIRGLFGQPSEAASSYTPGVTDLRSLAGLSPFTTYSVSLRQLKALPGAAFNSATEIMLVFELDSKSAPGKVPGVSSCN